MRVALSSAGRSAVRVHVALAAQVLAMAALVVFEAARGGPLAERIAAVGGDPRAPGAEKITGEVTLFALLVLAVFATSVAAAVAYLTWLRRVRRNAVWAWVIPGVNLIAPPFALHAAWEATGPAERRRRWWLPLLAAWWLSWLAALAMIVVSVGTHEEGLTGLNPAAVAVTALAAALCAATVREITYGTARRPAATRPFLPPLRRITPLAAPPRPAASPATPSAEEDHSRVVGG
ncbi:DUF4328 domain-containing protein [Thermopolyspora sp. NPDC052614]|uniref:DUF4328 domain-containing protein n=1 Tax=Thermopolyspora sp. NPDC052614 TaxID=3155682 RepID=UPI0034138317